MKTYTTPHSLIMMAGKQPPLSRLTLDAFYSWADRIGHWRICEAITRYRRIK